MSYFSADIFTSELTTINGFTISSGNITVTNPFNLETTQQEIKTASENSNLTLNNINSNIYGVLSNESNIANTEKLQAIRLYGYRNDAGIYTDAHYPLTLNNDALNVNLSNITTTANINNEVQNFEDNKIGVYNTTPPTLTNSDESKIRVSENAEPVIRQRCNEVSLPVSKANNNLSVPISCSGGYLAQPSLNYRYDFKNDNFVLDTGHPTHTLRDYRKNNQVYNYNVTFNYTNTSNNESLFFFQNDNVKNMFIYSISLEAQSPTNPANGEYMFVLLNVMTGLSVSGGLPQTNGNSRQSTFSFHAIPQGDVGNYTTGDTTASSTNRGQIMSLFIGQGARNYSELNLLDTLLRIRQNEGLRLRIEGNMQVNINYNLTIKYIRTDQEL